MKPKKTNLIVGATCLLALGSSISPSSAATIVFYDFEAASLDNPTTEATNTSSSTMTGAGWASGGSSSFGRSTAGNYFGRGPSTTPVTSYVAFTVTADPGYTLDLTQLDFDYYVQQDQSSQDSFTFEVRSSVDSFASAISGTYSLNPAGVTAPYQDASFNLSGATYDGLASIEFRLYATNDTQQNFGDIVRWDNITVSGDVTVVPEPSSSALVAMGLGGLALILRRRK